MRTSRGARDLPEVQHRPNDELHYWLATIVANSPGAAFGDLIGGIAVNLAILARLLALHYATRVSKGLLLRTAFVVTRVPF